MSELSEAARLARNAARRRYREENREAINAYNRAWKRAHPDRVREYERRYWERRAAAAAESEVSGDDC